MNRNLTITLIIISILITVMALTSCARVNKLDFTETGIIATTRGQVDIECELLPDGTRKGKISTKKGVSLWERIGRMVRPDKLELLTK